MIFLQPTNQGKPLKITGFTLPSHVTMKRQTTHTFLWTDKKSISVVHQNSLHNFCIVKWSLKMIENNTEKKISKLV